MTNPKCGDCAKFQKWHKTITKTGEYNSSCFLDINAPKYLPESQKDHYIKEYLKKRKLDDICDQFIEIMAPKKQKPIDICRHCIDNDIDPTLFKDNNWEKFNTIFCVTECDNSFIPKYLPKEQVIKYIKSKIEL